MQHGRHKSKSRNADFIIIARRAIPHPSGRRPVKLKNLKNPRLRNRRPLSPMNPGAPPLVPTAPPSRLAGKRVTGFSVAYGSLRIQFPCYRKRGDNKTAYALPCVKQIPLTRLFSSCIMSHVVVILCLSKISYGRRSSWIDTERF